MKSLKFIIPFLFICLTAIAADVKISQLPLGTAASTGPSDVFPYVVSSTSVTKKMTIWDIANIPTIAAQFASLTGSPTFTGTVTAAAFHGPLTGNVTGNVTGALTGNASTATALASNPTDCGSGLYANAIAANGNLTCAQVQTSQISGTFGVANGGTGAATFTQNGVLLGNGTSAIGATTAGSQYQVLQVASPSTAPTFGSVALNQSAAVSGALAIANGGTGQTTKAPAFDALSPMTTGGDIIYGGASGTGTRLANGSSGQVLTSAGGTSAPAWGPAGAMVLLATQTASSSATVDFTSISNGTYSNYKIIGENIVPSSNAVNLLVRMSVSGTFATTAYAWQNWRITNSGSGVIGQNTGGGATGIALDAAGGDSIVNSGNDVGISFEMTLYDMANTGKYKKCTYLSYYLGSQLIQASGGGTYQSNSAVDGFRFLMDSGNIASGTFKLYGLQ